MIFLCFLLMCISFLLGFLFGSLYSDKMWKKTLSDPEYLKKLANDIRHLMYVSKD